MKESIKISKKLLTLFLVVLISINSIAAVISDNDGSAFVTKAEFDALKNNFSAQIDNYNNSIDGKIDGAISAYLAGLKLESKEDIDCLLDSKGVYGKKYNLYWSGKDDKTVITDSAHYVLYTINYSEVAYDYTDDTWWGGTFKFPNVLLNGATNSNLDPYNVCRLYKIYEDDGTTLKETQLFYEKVKNTATFQLYFQFPNSRGSDIRVNSPSVPMGFSLHNLLWENRTDLKQKSLNNKVLTYFRKWKNGVSSIWSVWKQCYATLVQAESDTTDLRLAPFSDSNEKIWDKDENTIDMELTNATNYTDLQPYPSGVPTIASGYKTMNLAAYYKLPLVVPPYLSLPWQLLTDSVALKSRKIKNLIDISANNSSAEYGVYLGQIPEQNKEMTLTVGVKAEAHGTVYIYVGNSAVKNWTDSNFKGKKVDITDTDKVVTITYDNVTKNNKVWLLYKNNNADDKKVFINDFYITS